MQTRRQLQQNNALVASHMHFVEILDIHVSQESASFQMIAQGHFNAKHVCAIFRAIILCTRWPPMTVTGLTLFQG